MSRVTTGSLGHFFAELVPERVFTAYIAEYSKALALVRFSFLGPAKGTKVSGLLSTQGGQATVDQLHKSNPWRIF